MKIYTKKGDRGETSLLGGKKVPKDDLKIQGYGTLDELNSVLGLVLAESPPMQGLCKKSLEFKSDIQSLQSELFQLGTELATPAGRKPSIAIIESNHIDAMEKKIDAMEAQLQPLQCFILPGGSRNSALLHFARTISRRAERELITLHRVEPQRPVVLQYLNRISDYLFVLARFSNYLAKVEDISWIPPRKNEAL